MLLDCQAGLSLSSKHAESAKGICNSGTGDPNSIPIENYYMYLYVQLIKWSDHPEINFILYFSRFICDLLLFLVM